MENPTMERPRAVELDTRLLSEVDHLNRLRNFDGTYEHRDLKEIHENLITAVKEAAVPFAVSTTHQEYRDGTFYWLDQRPEDVAFSGYSFHSHESAIARVDVEVEEALNVNLNIRPGIFKIFISPRMSEIDAPYEIAKKEHLGDDDQIRIHGLNLNSDGSIEGKFMQSILIRDVPLSAWFAMLNDPNNIFGKALNIEDDGSALTVMKTHSQLEISEADLPGGVLDIAKAVLPYIEGDKRQLVEAQLELFSADQNEIHKKAEAIATRWLDFEIELSESLTSGYPTNEITNFIASLSSSWSDSFNQLIKDNIDVNGFLNINREIAVELEKAKRNTLWVSAAVSIGNEKIINKIGQESARRIIENEERIKALVDDPEADIQKINRISNQNNNMIAGYNIEIGGGCAGNTVGSISMLEMIDLFANRRENWKWSQGVCIMGTCANKGETVLVGPCSICRSCQDKFDRTVKT